MSGRFRIVNGRTGEIRVEPGYWWVLFKHDGSWSIVDVSEFGQDDLIVSCFGAEDWHSVEKFAETYEFMMPVPHPL